MSEIDQILAQIETLSPQDREQLFERLAGFEALRLRKAVQVQKERLSSQADGEGFAPYRYSEPGTP